MLDAAILQTDGKPFAQPFRLHDFRRSGATWMASAGFDTIAIDRILAHQPAALKGVAGTYQRHAFLEQRRLATEAWGRFVSDDPAASNIVTLAGRR